jgi:hypothetical protein
VLDALARLWHDPLGLASFTTLLALPLVVPLLVLLHEAGHALACVLLRRPVHELVVGGADPLVRLRLGSFDMRIAGGSAPQPGYVRFEPGRHAWTLVLVALAGPLASALACVASGLITALAWRWGQFDLVPAFATGYGALMVCASLSPARPGTDGRVALDAWRSTRPPGPLAPAWVDPNLAASVAPPAPARSRRFRRSSAVR